MQLSIVSPLYNEAESLPELHSWIKNIIVFNKGNDDVNIKYTDKINVISIENVGREGETYLQYIINNYDSLPEHIWFIQANPFEHSPDHLANS